jgi:hypothetical protein
MPRLVPLTKAPLAEALAMLASIAIEGAVASVLLRTLHWGSGRRGAMAAAIGTLFTHFLAWTLVLRLMDGLGYGCAVALVESGVVVFESLPYRLIVPLSWPRALFASLVANGASTGAALCYYAATG